MDHHEILGPVTPKKLYGIVALAEMITWAGLIIGMVLKYSDTTEALMPVVGLVHGVAFLSYALVTVFVWVNQRWSFGRGAMGLATAIIPFATLPFERNAEKNGLLDGDWRLVPGGETPHTVPEKIQAWALARPLVAVAVGVVGVAAVTAILLIIGPPVPKD